MTSFPTTVERCRVGNELHSTHFPCNIRPGRLILGNEVDEPSVGAAPCVGISTVGVVSRVLSP